MENAMGSNPSRPSGVESETAAKNYFVDAREAIDEVQAYCQHARALMRSLKQVKLCDEEATGPLRNLYQTFFRINSCRANISSKVFPKVCSILISESIVEMFVKFWDQCHKKPAEFYDNVESTRFKNMLLLKSILWNFSDKCEELATTFYKNEVAVERIMREFSMPQLGVSKLGQEMLRENVKADLGILHNSLRHMNQLKELIRKNDGIKRILAYEKSPYLMIKAVAVIVLAYCIKEEENSKIIAGTGVITFMLAVLESALNSHDHVAKTYLFSAEEIAEALTKLASNEENKKSIVEEGGLPLLTKLLDIDTSSSIEHLHSVSCIWSLAFHKDNKRKIIEEPGLLNGVTRLRRNQDGDDRLKKAIEGLIFVLDLEQPAPKPVSALKGTQKHIMISYNWGVQPTMLKVRDYLQSHNLNIWMDVDQIHGSILSAMADAVENSALVLVAMTEAYKDSSACRTEAEYAYSTKVPILPLRLQADYKADGWLGALAGMKLYVDLSSANYEKRLPDVLKEIRSLVKVSEKTTTQGAVPKPHAPVQPKPADRPTESSDRSPTDLRQMQEKMERMLALQEENASEIRNLKTQIEKLEKNS